MSMVINLVEDHNIYLCEGGPVYNGGIQPTPITYLTQWKIVGNSQVHTDPFLTSWKVSGNSVVDNNTILSCGDLGQDGKYHVKISNGVTIYDIPLTKPLRKVNEIADTIEFPSDTEGKALVTRCLTSFKIYNTIIIKEGTAFRTSSNNLYKSSNNHINTKYPVYPIGTSGDNMGGFGIKMTGTMFVFKDDSLIDKSSNNFKEVNKDIEIVCELATPTTELVDVSPFPVSATDTYTSANVIPFSAFEHTENKEIWSCGEYNATDGKYHILVKPLGGSIVDIALDAPLRKVNDVADTIEFPSDVDRKALITRNTGAILVKDLLWQAVMTVTNLYRMLSSLVPNVKRPIDNNTAGNIICPKYNNISVNQLISQGKNLSFALSNNGYLSVLELPYSNSNDSSNYIRDNNLLEFIYELDTPTTELVDAPQIEEADSYTCVISQGGKAVSWSSFETNSE